jgi:hypothetical protein
MAPAAEKIKSLRSGHKTLPTNNLDYCPRAPKTINIRNGKAGTDIKQLHIVTAFVVLVNIQPFGLFFLRHAEPYHKVNDLQENKG